ncbi:MULTISPECIES: SAF domain-containing protein [unclassified Paenarthrobacter]|uniref:SAF domain-containing protein n=1 Tax=unclassified Paenarthrobacter TaxID=2634190 RepID=UPI003CEC44DA
MKQGAAVEAVRLRKPSWKDPRLLIGVLLVLLSVSGVVAVTSSADKTIPVYAAREDIAVGQTVTAEDLAVVNVRLDDVEPAYVTVGGGLADGQVALQRVARSELLPRQSLGRPDDLNRKPVAVSVKEMLPPQAVPGARLDVWVAMPGPGGSFGDPQLLLPGAEIAHITPGSTGLGSAKETVVLVLVTDEQMPKLLAALANEAAVSVVWNPAGVAK